VTEPPAPNTELDREIEIPSTHQCDEYASEEILRKTEEHNQEPGRLLTNKRGSLTGLPIVTVIPEFRPTFVPTNVIAVTDSQILLDQELFKLHDK
jgi:hypothetical protein